MVDASEFRPGQLVAVREEYRSNPTLQGRHEGMVMCANKIGTVMVYTLSLGDMIRVNITHGALRAAM